MKEIEDIFGQISNVLRLTYLLTYQPPYEPAEGKFRRIEVMVGDDRNIVSEQRKDNSRIEFSLCRAKMIAQFNKNSLDLSLW